MNKLIIIMSIVLLSGCEISNDARVLLDYKCSAEQLELVKKEYDICKESSYLDSFCYSTAKKTQCTKIMVRSE